MERQKAELNTRLKREMTLKKKAFDKIMKYRAWVKQFRCIIELNWSRLFIKTVDELKKQNKEIKKQIACKRLMKKKKQNAINVKTAEWDIKLFL